MTREIDKKPPESGAVFTFGKSQIADSVPSKFWLKNDKPVLISCGHSHSAFVTEHGRLFVFGSNSGGQLGLESKGPITKPVCVKARGEIFAAGRNSEGQLGLGHCEERTSFQQLHPFCDGAPLKQLSAGCNTSAALTEDGRLFMWGDNSVGQLGLGSENLVLFPKLLKVDRSVTGISCGLNHSALITDIGDVYTFGEAADGRLGLSEDQLANHRQPQRVGSLEGVLQVSCGGTHTLALTGMGLLYCIYTSVCAYNTTM
ncbi:X-linked retinitis pigmentosa GTPase regulator [Astyanax mexicanus]|uniref:X-linked retinitis pigmentosa GTPase regulator n=1 Tax=Astyanax mexicanus TaxID=7994 RepID=UPI0020CB533D|nr:X-linked retinitis pigmentosa GTPase regulator [Astyanax mexicanus]